MSHSIHIRRGTHNGWRQGRKITTRASVVPSRSPRKAAFREPQDPASCVQNSSVPAPHDAEWRDEEAVAIVLGGYVTGYAIIRELHECGVPNIWLIDISRSIASYSNKVIGWSLVRDDVESLRVEITRLASAFKRTVLFPSSDTYIEALQEICGALPDTCYVPFREEKVLSFLDKSIQYDQCKRLDVPFPNTVKLGETSDLRLLESVMFPVILKPCKHDSNITSFKTLLLSSDADLAEKRGIIEKCLASGTQLLVSEVIPGDGGQIYAYTAYRSFSGKILSEWTGKKLAQFPTEIGVFSSASNETLDEVRELGRKLVDGMDLVGIVEPEFKYDPRDQKLKLMEVNLRTMMWARLGSLSGVHVQYAQWLDAMGRRVPTETQQLHTKVHFVYMYHEIVNLLARRGYWQRFRNNVFGGDNRCWAVFSWDDPVPAIVDLKRYPRAIVSAFLRRIQVR